MNCSKCESNKVCGKVATEFTERHTIPMKWEYRCKKCLKEEDNGLI